MVMVRKTITFTKQQDAWIKGRIGSGDYASDSEYMRDLIRRDQQQNEKFHTLRSAIEEGLNSGISDKQIPDIMKDVEDRLRANGKL
jgi:antitoxin ParD1/3/4